jgi:uncharacterized repeat protein (TIGR02543 family)
MNTKNAKGLFMVLSILTVLAGCELPVNSPQKESAAHNGQGNLLLSFSGLGVEQAGVARTILPVTVINNFMQFDLDFTSTAWDGNPQSFTIPAAEIVAPVQISLPAGITWDLAVTGYVSGESGSYLPAAEGGETGIVITDGNTSSIHITLTAVIDEGIGTFSYSLQYPADVTGATLTVTPLSATGTPERVIDSTGGAQTGKVLLKAGYYRVTVALINPAGSAGKRDILHIYKNLTSSVNYAFTERDFLLPTLSFDENGGSVLDPALAVQTVEYGTVFSAITLPTTTRTYYDFIGWFTETSGGTQYAIDSIITTNITLYAQWSVVAVSAPGAPTVKAGDKYLTLSWTAVAGATTYEVWTGTSNNPMSATKYGGDVDRLETVVTGLANGTTYHIWIKAKNSVYTSDFSPVESSFLPDWIVSTLAGSTIPGNTPLGYADGTGTEAQFYNPIRVAVDSADNVYVTDHHRIRKITPGGVVTTLAGSDNGYADGTGTEAQFSFPQGVAVDSANYVYVADSHRIRKITPGGEVATFAGSSAYGYADGTGSAARFSAPVGVAVDNAGNVYVAELDNHRIRKITPGGEVTTLAGSGVSGYADGTGTTALFSNLSGIAVDSTGNVYVADASNHRIRKITPSGVVTTFAGSGASGYADGTGTEAQFFYPQGVAVDSADYVYVADYENHRIRKITPDGVVTTIAGNGSYGPPLNGAGMAARIGYPWDVAVDSAGIIYFADGCREIRKITRD